MPTLSGTVMQPGYETVATVQIEGFGYGVHVIAPPPLPSNPYMGYSFPKLLAVDGFSWLAGSGRKLFRDGVIVFPPYPGITYDVVVIWANSAVGLDWQLQY